MNANTKKKVLRLIPYGLFVATSRADQTFGAGTINWVTQTSFTPPLVVVAIQLDSSLHEVIAASRIFALHVLGKNQKELAAAFFKGAQPDGGTLNGYRIESGATGAPILLDAPAWFECRVLDEVRRGDHTIFVGEVVEAGSRREEEPLTLRDTGFFYGG
ncbi:MAG: flavin reductase family protein [Candidatus Acidiferrales bacterium]|jgi:flavin reductase (DIM6/NTAB) family NADH-FMN oxidoreductase RutF